MSGFPLKVATLHYGLRRSHLSFEFGLVVRTTETAGCIERVDENRRVPVLTAQEARLNGHPDENHAGFALKNGCVLLTYDRDYLDEQRFPLIHCLAIAVFDFGSGS